VEEGPTDAIFEDPKHPYTQGLLKSIPKLGERARHGRKRLQEISGIVPSLYDLPAGCSFSPRCPRTMEICKQNVPGLTRIDESRRVRCYLY
jgi:oligopeptide/dipeptide ABC transporter ATP-binding protein